YIDIILLIKLLILRLLLRYNLSNLGIRRSGTQLPSYEPLIVLSSAANVTCGNENSAFGSGKPVVTVEPPRFVIAYATCIAGTTPAVSNTYSAPPVTYVLTSSITFSSLELNTAVAPKVLAISNLSSLISKAISSLTPASLAPIIALSPMPPRPTTATLLPGLI